MEALRFVSIDIWTILFTWINLLILSALVRKFLLKPVNRILEQREQEIGALYAQAEAGKQAAEQIRGQYEQKMADAGQEAAELLKNAEQAAQKKESAIVAEAREKAGRLLRDGQTALQLLQEKERQKNREQLAELAVLGAETILRRELNEKDYEALVLKTIDELGDVS